MNYAVEQSYSFFCVVATLFCLEEARCGNKKKRLSIYYSVFVLVAGGGLEPPTFGL